MNAKNEDPKVLKGSTEESLAEKRKGRGGRRGRLGREVTLYMSLCLGGGESGINA